MSRFRKLAHTIWHCQYHIVWVPKYRHRILTGKIGKEDKIRQYVKYQEDKERREEQMKFGF